MTRYEFETLDEAIDWLAEKKYQQTIRIHVAGARRKLLWKRFTNTFWIKEGSEWKLVRGEHLKCGTPGCCDGNAP